MLGVGGEEYELHEAGGAVGTVDVVPAQPAVLLGGEAGRVERRHQAEEDNTAQADSRQQPGDRALTRAGALV